MHDITFEHDTVNAYSHISGAPHSDVRVTADGTAEPSWKSIPRTVKTTAGSGVHVKSNEVSSGRHRILHSRLICCNRESRRGAKNTTDCVSTFQSRATSGKQMAVKGKFNKSATQKSGLMSMPRIAVALY
uniref:Transposase n=1 Tax=Panagrellus redivivus TaxID=6233 RepID=A0A7E4V3C8_PANRE